ncbi:MAG: FeoB-associated Cys-rich membrane protein [Eubacteriales bacterium]|nr:FeoB-associated Cys-rich membrane protein [Eubacteriales bacterium]
MINYLIGIVIGFAVVYIIVKQFTRIKAGKCSVHGDCESCGVNVNCPTQNKKDDKR